MTQTPDPWAAASGHGTATQTATAPQDNIMPQTGSDYDPLFGGEPLPSLFNRQHGIGEKLTGVIKDVPFDVQKRQYGTGKPLYWSADGKMVEEAVAPSGQPNRQIMETVVPLDTQYRLTPAELQQRGQDSDSGARGWYCGGNDLKALRAAIRKSGARTRQDLVGMKLTAWRSGQVPSGKGNPAWTYEAELTR